MKKKQFVNYEIERDLSELKSLAKCYLRIKKKKKKILTINITRNIKCDQIS